MTSKKRLKQAVCRKCGNQVLSKSELGYGLNGMVDFFCPECQGLMVSVPLEDLDPAMRRRIQGMVQLVHRLRRKP